MFFVEHPRLRSLFFISRDCNSSAKDVKFLWFQISQPFQFFTIKDMITRRDFIQTLGFAAIAGASLNLGGSAFGQTLKTGDLYLLPTESLSDPLLYLTGEHFTPFIDTEFQIRLEGSRRAETLRLIGIKEFRSKANDAKGVQGSSFSLLFENTREAQLAQNVFEFSHAALGTFTLFLSPVNKEPNRYEAVINHLRA